MHLRISLEEVISLANFSRPKAPESPAGPDGPVDPAAAAAAASPSSPPRRDGRENIGDPDLDLDLDLDLEESPDSRTPRDADLEDSVADDPDPAPTPGEGVLPPAISELTCADDVVVCTIDMRELAHESLPLRLAAAAAPEIHIRATFSGFDPATQIATFLVEARARSLPAHRIVNLLAGPLSSILSKALIRKDLPAHTITLTSGDGIPHLAIDLGSVFAHATASRGIPLITVAALAVRDGEVDVEATWPV